MFQLPTPSRWILLDHIDVCIYRHRNNPVRNALLDYSIQHTSAENIETATLQPPPNWRITLRIRVNSILYDLISI